MRKIVYLFVGCAVSTLAGLAAPIAAQAASHPYVMPQETRLVKFRFHPDTTFEIFTRPNAITDIALADGEKLTALALGDTVQWVTADADGHVFIKPLRPGLFTTATLVTSQRTYQLSLRSVPENGNWYQRVSWEDEVHNVIVRSAQTSQRTPEPAYSPAPGIGNIDKMNFGYSINGSAAFKPTQVMDDGRSTWIQMPNDVQELPALFSKQDGKVALVNYTVHGRYLKTELIMAESVLRLGGDEITITRDGR